MLLVANFGQYKMMRKPRKMTETMAHGYSPDSTQRQRELSNEYQITNMTGLKWFQQSLHHCASDKSSLSIGRVNACRCKMKQTIFVTTVSFRYYLYEEY